MTSDPHQTLNERPQAVQGGLIGVPGHGRYDSLEAPPSHSVWRSVILEAIVPTLGFYPSFHSRKVHCEHLGNHK